MQFTQARALKKGFAISSIGLKWVMLGACTFFLYGRLSGVEFSALLGQVIHGGPLVLGGGVLVLLLMPINWLVEAQKWRMLTAEIAPLSTRKSLQSVFAGISLGFVTPRAIGDYFGRMLTFENRQKAKVVVPMVIARVAQLIPTVCFGLFGFLILFRVELLSQLLFTFVLLLLVIAFLFLFNYSRFHRWVTRLFPQLAPYFDHKVSSQLLTRILLLSFVRYGIFTTQFMLAMMLFQVEASTSMMLSGITWIFLAKSVFPSFSVLGDLGIREFSAVLFFETMGVPIAPVVAASLFVWLINLALPAILGLVAIQRSF